MEYRVAFAAKSIDEAIESLRSATCKRATRRRIAFQFSGQGSQFVGMGRELYEAEPVYRDAIDACCELALELLGLDLRTLLFGAEDAAAAAQLQATRYAQPAIFITEFALAKLWQTWGIVPEAVVGHSLGEYVAATVAGVFSWEQALRIVCLRGRLMDAMEPGAMTSVALDETSIGPYLLPGVSLAALNSPRASVFSGTFPAVEAVEAALAADGLTFRHLRTSHAFHSAMMQPMVAEFEADLAKLTLQAPTMPFMSSVTGRWITPEQATNPHYWADQVILPVRFGEAIAALTQDGIDLLLEVGPGEALTALALHQRKSGDGSFTALASLPMPRAGEAKPIQNTVAALWMEGVEPEWTAVFAAERPMRVSAADISL